MSTSSTMTIRLDAVLKGKLERLAQDTKRSKSFLAAAAVEAYVARELSIIEGVHLGLADLAAGRAVSHEEAVAEIEALLGLAD